MAEAAKATGGDDKAYFVEGAPPPDVKQRELIFDSFMKIVKKGDRKNARGKQNSNRGTYIATWGAGYSGQLGQKITRYQKKYSAVPLYLDLNVVVRQVTCGGLHTAIVTESGSVYTFGDGRQGQLGHGGNDPTAKTEPRVVDALAGVFVVSVACGYHHTVAITDTGGIYSWGHAKNGQTGHGDRSRRPLPEKIFHENAKEIVSIAAGNKHTIAINKQGEVVSFGSSEHGQTGLGQTGGSDILVPTKIETLIEANVFVESIACGSIHSCFVTSQGEVFLCGFGEFFHPNESQHFFYDPKKIDMPEPIKQISCGQSHNLALSTNGNVYTWGSGDYGQLGYGIFGNLSTPRLVLENKGMEQVAAGRYHSLALSNMGVLYSWGCGENGQLGQNSDENLALPTVVGPILGSVVGQVACGEHHTAVISSAPWSKLSLKMAEWKEASRTEHEKKVDRLKKTHRGLTRKDLGKIAEDMRKWHDKEEERKKQVATEEQEELERDLASIQYDGNFDDEARAQQVERAKTMKLPSVTDGRTEDEEQYEANKAGAAGGVRLPKVNKKAKAQQAATIKKSQTGNFDEADSTLPDPTQQASLTRTAFLKETAAYVREMKAVVGASGESQSNKHLHSMMRLVIEYRKEYDMLKNISRDRLKRTEDLKREASMMERSYEGGKESLTEFADKLKDLEMQLQTVTIKIAETSENRRNYELNISHLKEEDFEHFNQLKALRKQNHDNNNFFKKMNELKVQALEEKEKAEEELAEFKTEIQAYQKFVNSQLSQFEQILDIVRTQNENRERAKHSRDDKIQAKINLRIEKLELEAEAAEKEVGGLTSRLTSLDLKLRHFEDSFQKITAATGLTNPDAIVNKFFFKGEIKVQLNTEIEDKQTRIEELKAAKAELANELKEAKGNFTEQTWRDVDIRQEEQRETGTKESKTKEELDKQKARLAFVQEGLLSVMKQLTEANDEQVDNSDLSSGNSSIWSEQQVTDLLSKFIPTVDQVVAASKDYEAKLREEREHEAKIQVEAAKMRKLEHGGLALDAFGLGGGGGGEAPPAEEEEH